MKSPISQSATISGMKLNSRSPLMSWGIVLGLSVIYLFTQPLLISLFGPSAVTLIAIPVALATWHFRFTGGLIFGFILTLFDIIFFIPLEQDGLNNSTFLGLFPGLIMLVLLITFTNYLKELVNKHTQTELNLLERERFSSSLNEIGHSIITSYRFAAEQ